MQDPASEIKDVVRILLKGKHNSCCNKEGGCAGRLNMQIQKMLVNAGSITERLKVIDTCFTADAKFIHPLLTLRGRYRLCGCFKLIKMTLLDPDG